MKITILRDLTPCSLVDCYLSCGFTYYLHLQDKGVNSYWSTVLSFSLLVFILFFYYSFTQKMEAVLSFEMPITIYQTTQRHISEDSVLQKFPHLSSPTILYIIIIIIIIIIIWHSSPCRA
jgi:hypothetical protein